MVDRNGSGNDDQGSLKIYLIEKKYLKKRTENIREPKKTRVVEGRF